MRRKRINSEQIPEPGPGQETWAEFKSRQGEDYVRYCYRCKSGRLFSTIAPDLNLARRKRDAWLVETRLKEQQQNE
ncbi:MAG: DUF3873 family protein [Pseudomonadota bacterium]